MGFWHLEPIGSQRVLLTGAAIYALINAIGSILRRTRTLFDAAMVYAGDRSRRWNGYLHTARE